MTSRSRTGRESNVQSQVTARAKAQHTRRRYRLAAWAGTLVLIAAVVTAALLTSRQATSTTQRQAPGFTLLTTAGSTVSLSDYRGRPVILYFNEGAGCGSCSLQLAGIEEQKEAFDKAGLTVLPIVMNTREQIQPDLDQYGVTTPVLLDDGTVSKAYGTLGKGMHAGLPGHSFVLINTEGKQIWYSDYPSMWLQPQELLAEATARLRS